MDGFEMGQVGGCSCCCIKLDTEHVEVGLFWKYFCVAQVLNVYHC